MTSDHVDHVLYNLKEFMSTMPLLATMPLSMDGCGTEFESLMDKDYEPKEEEAIWEDIEADGEEDIEEEDVEADGESSYRRGFLEPKTFAPSWKNAWHQQNPGARGPPICSLDSYLFGSSHPPDVTLPQ